MTNRKYMRRFVSAAMAMGFVAMVSGCSEMASPVPGQTHQPVPTQTSQPVETVDRAPHDSVLESLVSAQKELPDVFASAVLANDGSLTVNYDESSPHAADFIRLVEETSASDAVIRWAEGGFPSQDLPQLAERAFVLAQEAGFEAKGGSLSADGAIFFVLSPRVPAEQTIGFVAMEDRTVEIVVQAGESVPESAEA